VSALLWPIWSFGRRGLSQPMCWLAREVRAMFWAIFAVSEWAQPTTVVEERQVRALL
jgi:hypothetical protein